MKKIMFNDRYGLTQAVLEGRKTMTRRLLKVPLGHLNSINFALHDTVNLETNKQAIIKRYAQYAVGEDVAVAQSYRYVYDTIEEQLGNNKANEWWFKAYDVIDNQFGPATTPGYNNKLFVRADLMPYRIKITNIKVERLQDISEEDCLREGIKKMEEGVPYRFDENWKIHLSADPRMLFADLIDRISGRGTWQRNPYVFVYSFQLIR